MMGTGTRNDSFLRVFEFLLILFHNGGRGTEEARS